MKAPLNILLIEDDAFKAKRIRGFLSKRLPTATIDVERSVSTGLSKLVEVPRPDGLLLDMSLSTFDVGPREIGGRPQNFGGIAILEHMARRSIDVPVAIITQFETFPKGGRDIGLGDIRKELKDRFPKLFKCLIYYNSRETDWELTVDEFLGLIGASST